MNQYYDSGNPFYDENYGLSDETEEAVGQTTNEEAVETTSADEDEQLMAKAEKRLEIANYYKSLLQNSLFDIPDEAAQRVESEVRAFVRSRLEVLLGMRAEKPVVQQAAQFTKDEVMALKKLAEKLIGQPKLLDNTPKAKPVQVKAVPVPNKVKAPEAPKLPKKEEVKAEPPTPPKAPLPKAKPGRPSRKTKTVFNPKTGEEVEIDAREQVKNPAALPILTPQQQEIISQQQAQMAISRVDDRFTTLLKIGN